MDQLAALLGGPRARGAFLLRRVSAAVKRIGPQGYRAGAAL